MQDDVTWATVMLHPSRQLDLEVAKAIGWQIDDRTARSPSGSAWARQNEDGTKRSDDEWLPFYSSDVGAAWQFVEFLMQHPRSCQERLHPAASANFDWLFRRLAKDLVHCTAEEAARCICIGALQSLGIYTMPNENGDAPTP